MDGLRRSIRQTTKPDRLGEWLEQSVKQTPDVTLTKGKSLDTLDDAEVLTLPPSPPLSRNESWPLLAIDLESLGDSSSRVSGCTCRSNGSTSSSVKLAHLQAELQAAERLAHMEEEERKIRLETKKKLIAMQLAVEHADIANRERSLSRSSGSTASGASVRSVPGSRHTMTVCKAFSSVDNQIAPAISTTQVPQPEGHVSVPPVTSSKHTVPVCKASSSVKNPIAHCISPTQVPQPEGHAKSDVMPSCSYSNENKSAPELERVSGDTENLYLRHQLQQQQEEFSLKEQTYQRLVAEAHATEKLAQAIGKVISVQPKPTEGREMSHLLARQAAGKDLPNFSGLPEEWPTFSHLFRTSTRDCGFSHAENIGRLQRCLKGKAKEAVQLFLSVPENVPEVMKTLEERFGRPDVIIQQLISKAKSYKQLRADDFEALMEFSTSVRSLVHTMQLMNCTGHMRNPQLKQELVEKLPAIHRLYWGETISNRPPDDICLKDFSVWLTNRARAACAVAGPTRLLDEAPRTRIERLHVAVETRTCDFCGKPDHAVQACRQFSTLAASERWDWAKAERRCFACLKVHHTARVCQERKVCQKDGCDRYHHQLHKDRGNSVATQFNGHNNTISPVVLLRILPVRLSGPAGYFDTYAMLDEGSTVTLIDKTVANILGAAGQQDSLVMRWTDSTQHQFLESQRINIGIRGEGEDLFTLKGVRTVDNLDLPVQSVSRERLAAQWTHLTDDRVPSLSRAKPTILIGQNNCQLSVAREVVEGPANSPILTKTKLGWVVHGQLPYGDRNRADGHTVLHIHEAPAHDYLHQLVKDSFTTENFGEQVSAKRRAADYVARAERLLDTTTVRIGERFETGLLWKEDKPGLPHSKDTAQFTMRRNAEEHGEEFLEILAATTDNYYMDDYFDSVPSESTAIQKIADTIEVQGRGGFLIRNWISSSSEVLNTVPADIRAAGDVDFKPDTVLPVKRTLGLRWDPNQDSFLFIVRPARASPSSHLSKRELLSVAMSVFDPSGFLAAFTVIARILLQDVWPT